MTLTSTTAQLRRDRARHPLARPRAFTLLELILVMTILVLVVSMLAPSLRGFASLETLLNELPGQSGRSSREPAGVPFEASISVVVECQIQPRHSTAI